MQVGAYLTIEHRRSVNVRECRRMSLDYRTPEPSKPGPYLLKGLKRVSVSNSPIADANAGECRLNYRAGPAVQAVQV